MDYHSYISGSICGKLERGIPVVLASIVSMEGSTPRGTGSKMVVAGDGTTFGTVGGGLMEATTIAEAGRILETGKSKFLEIDMSGTDTSSPDMICGGSAVLLLDRIENTAGNRDIFLKARELIDEGTGFYLVTAYREENNRLTIDGHCLLFATGSIIGDEILSSGDLPAIREELHNVSSTMILSFRDRQFVIDPIRRIKTMFCFGAGHVAVPTAHIAALTGFSVTIIDDREEYANRERFPDAERVVVIDDYNRALKGFDIDGDSFIVILTRGHRYDREVLEQAIKTNAGYIGMISSRKKRDAVYSTLIQEGIATAKDLERVHSPIGLPIGGETPEEIAVSIVAEMISVREKKER